MTANAVVQALVTVFVISSITAVAAAGAHADSLANFMTGIAFVSGMAAAYKGKNLP